jgi:hypothetical protein
VIIGWHLGGSAETARTSGKGQGKTEERLDRIGLVVVRFPVGPGRGTLSLPFRELRRSGSYRSESRETPGAATDHPGSIP